MRVGKEAELNAAILHFIAKCLAEGDHQTLSDLGLDRKDAEAIESLSLTDVDHLSSVNFPLLRKGSIDRDLFCRLMERIRDLREHTSVRDELLARDAPFPMMHEHFGMDAGEYAERGRRIAVLRRSGRPAEPSEEEGAAVWRAYEALDKPKDQLLRSKEYLILCKTTGLSARTVWTVMHRLLAAQEPAATGAPQRREGPQPTRCGDRGPDRIYDTRSERAGMTRDLDPATQALEAYIEASVEQLLQRPSNTPHKGLLFLSAWHEAMPALVHLDPVLEAVDSRVFAVLWIWAKQQGRGSTAFPSYEYLLQRCNIQSRATVARSLAILRMTRWVTLCRRVREKGRNRGNIYALHDEPLALAATLYLDPGYMDFLKNARHHHHEHVGRVAHALLQSLQESIDEGEDVLSAGATSQAAQRLEALATIAGEGGGDYFGLRRGVLSALRSTRNQPPAPHAMKPTKPVVNNVNEPQVQNLNSEPVQKLNSSPVQNLNSVLCSSSYLIKPTTTEGSQEDRARASPAEARLIFPESLSRNEQALAAMYLKGLAFELQQALLDELGEKIQFQAKTPHRVRNAIGLLCWMCGEAKAGRPPLTSAYLQNRERRDRERALHARIEAEQRRLTELALREVAARQRP